MADVHYGPFVRNRLDFWPALTVGAAPVLVYIHGGGFFRGDKAAARDDATLAQCLDAGVSIVAIDYRYLGKVSLPEVLRDCARAVQFVRTKSREWNIDRGRIGAYGVSAGAAAALWLAFHSDLGDSKNADPVLRESTRLRCVGAVNSQCSYDFMTWCSMFGNDVCERYARSYHSPAIFGFATDAELATPAGRRVRADCEMLGLIERDAPPVFLQCAVPAGKVTTGNILLHHPWHSQLLYERCRAAGIEVVGKIPALDIAPPAGAPDTLLKFLVTYLAGGEPP